MEMHLVHNNSRGRLLVARMLIQPEMENQKIYRAGDWIQQQMGVVRLGKGGSLCRVPFGRHETSASTSRWGVQGTGATVCPCLLVFGQKNSAA